MIFPQLAFLAFQVAYMYIYIYILWQDRVWNQLPAQCKSSSLAGFEVLVKSDIWTDLMEEEHDVLIKAESLSDYSGPAAVVSHKIFFACCE